MDPYDNTTVVFDRSRNARGVWSLLTLLAVITGLALAIDSAFTSSATYDEVTYLRVAARWWRTGDQAEITRMGSPLTFWKLQQVPVLWILDCVGRGDWIDDPTGHESALLPVVRIGSLWLWLAGLLLTAAWSRSYYGPKAMALAAWIFALSPNLLAHGCLATMEMPLVAASTAAFWSFWRFLETQRVRWLCGAAALTGLAFSCKFTAVLFPPIFVAVWIVARWHDESADPDARWPRLRRAAARMALFMLVMVAADIVVTGFACLPLSPTRGEHPSVEKWMGKTIGYQVARLYETPIPQDWAGLAVQMNHQRSGGPSFLWGVRRMTGWWYYYFVAMAVKIPLGFWLLVVARLALTRRLDRERLPDSQGRWLPVACLLFLAITAAGSSRNYGLRYVLPIAPLAIVWVSAIAEVCDRAWSRATLCAGLGGFVIAVVNTHPHELTYFNVLAGGREGGRHVLADSNLDWGQGLKSLARLQKERRDFQDITLYYFGDTEPARYGVKGEAYVIRASGNQPCLPDNPASVSSEYIAVAASLQWGPWGPPGYFGALDAIKPVAMTDDTTIAVYRTADISVKLAGCQ